MIQKEVGPGESSPVTGAHRSVALASRTGQHGVSCSLSLSVLGNIFLESRLWTLRPVFSVHSGKDRHPRIVPRHPHPGKPSANVPRLAASWLSYSSSSQPPLSGMISKAAALDPSSVWMTRARKPRRSVFVCPSETMGPMNRCLIKVTEFTPPPLLDPHCFPHHLTI